MMISRPIVRSSLPRATRSLRAPRCQIRFQSTASSPGGSHFATGLAGGVAGAALFYGIYSFTPAGQTASKINKAAKEAEKTYQAAAKRLQEKTPTPEEAVNSIKEFAYSYAGWIPGGRSYVDTAFNDWDTVRKNHRKEADQLVNEAYKKFQDISKLGLSLEAASQAYNVLADLSKKIAGLAGDALSDILDNHPQVKEKLGGSVDQLKQLGDQYGPEAKKQVDETWGQVKDVFATGFGASSLEKARKLVEEKVEQIKKLGDEAWKKGLQEAKPLLEKSPKVKELVEKNADALKQGNTKELFEKVKSAAESGDLGDLEGYVKKAVDQVKSKGSDSWVDVDKYLKMIPQGDSILEKLQKLREVADEHKEEGEKLFKETVEELKQVLEKKSERAEEIVNNAKNNAAS
ncbi:hypothetical protein G7Z17_g4980 [Cylindrodendrum hubeiense]|uniref:Apolipoprotein/apolipophorin n=1 Tax=Cylindrodendrum hubeiense TaxID=595255 RepID=A0A9P5H7Q0_9HYPO|nr:hypothetical protein G7Z17_g4980 [Cylindrodendrum hubeiense]